MFGTQIAQPFAGGISAPNHQFVDIDGDGDLDLFVLDDDLNVDFYRNVGTRTAAIFELQPDAIQLPAFQTFFLFVDLNADGLIDLITDNFSSGVRYYQNAGVRGQPIFLLTGNPIMDADGHPLFAGFSSIPAFGDFNGDGLVDFISSNTADGSINYYENRGTASTPAFKLITTALQGITIIGDTCFTRQSAIHPQDDAHGSGAYSVADIDSNGTTDIFYGDFFSSGLFLLKNAGTRTIPFIECGSNHYPPAEPVATSGFNQPTLVDIDGDGDLDLFVGVLNNMQRHGFWYYENTGNASAPQFQLRTKDYLSVIDVGQDASPTLTDIDGDGKLDIVVGTLNGQLWYFHNSGTVQNPSFTLADTLFGGISGNFSYAPTFADINGDGLKDAVVGQFNGVVKFYRNIGTTSVPQYDLDPAHVDSVKVGKFDSAPALIDIDGDGDLDLFVGKSDGTLSFYRNDGTVNAPSWARVSEFYQNIFVVGNAKPVFQDMDNDGDADLLVGNADGEIFFYENFGTAQSPIFRCSLRNFITPSHMRDAALTLGDLDGDGDLDVIVGTSKGGLHFYRNVYTGGPVITHSVRLVTPADDARNQILPVTFRWTASGCANGYQLQVAGDTAFTRLIVNDSSLTDTSSVASALAHGSQYFWRVQTRFEGGQVVQSETRSFTTIPAIPPTPVLMYPANHATGQVLILRLQWNMSPGAALYHVQFASDPTFDKTIVDDTTVTDSSYLVGPLARGTKYYWRVRAMNIAGRSAYSDGWSFTTSAMTAYTLRQNFPNPVREETQIMFSLQRDEYVRLTLYNMLGKDVATLLNQTLPAGEYAIPWNAVDFPSGVYYYRLVTHDFTAIKKLVLTK
ncbi:MAG: VCBS repeat-containing protein [Ignavibacteriae bacterium]|nr:VCBS repeat-containing protein [Ignavibacteria bacterium]MBI3364190.1 VCBS repeat-containing protein [Ignavibacteriota bacterium]